MMQTVDPWRPPECPPDCCLFGCCQDAPPSTFRLRDLCGRPYRWTIGYEWQPSRGSSSPDARPLR
jgi:hypothetical protein